MKTKYFLIYVFVGIAFLAVSAWVFFSRGKNAKAIRAKYSLSPGAVLTVDVDCKYYDQFGIVIRKFEDYKEGDVLQRASFESGGKEQFQYTLVYDPADKAYTGTVQVDIYAYPKGSEEGYLLYSNFLLITTGEN